MGVKYASSEPDIQSSLRKKIIDNAREGEGKKPWDLVQEVADEPEFAEEDVRAALKQLTLKGELRIASSGRIQVTTTTA